MTETERSLVVALQHQGYVYKQKLPKTAPDELVRQVADAPLSVEKIIADDGKILHFHFSDGTDITHTWADRSRTESWTPEMKEKTRPRIWMNGSLRPDL